MRPASFSKPRAAPIGLGVCAWLLVGSLGYAIVQGDRTDRKPPANGPPAYHRYWGDVHGHTVFSDGNVTVDQYFRYARESAHLDFVIVTDHDFGHQAPWRLPKEHWRQIQDAAAAVSVPGRFIGLAGYEWTSQPKYWKGFTGGPSEGHFPGAPRYYNHKNVYFLGPVESIYSAKDPATMTPDLLAARVEKAGGLIQNNHPAADLEGRDQFDYQARWSSVITNTEMLADQIRYQGKSYDVRGEQTVRAFLDKGGRTGFVGSTDTHDGKPAARTAVLASALDREALFEALRHRRNYAVSNARIGLDFTIDGHWMGEEITVRDPPRLTLIVEGTAKLDGVEVIRNGAVCRKFSPGTTDLRCTWEDADFPGAAYYYVRVTQADADENGNPSRAWSSPIWVTRAEPMRDGRR